MGIGTISRRRVIQGVGAAGIVGISGLQPAGAQPRDPLDRYIVGTEPGEADVAIDAAAEVYLVLDFDDIGQAVSGWYSDEALEGLEQNPNVRYIEPEGVMEAIDHTTDEDDGDPNEEQVLPWGIDRVDADVAHHDGETGGGSSIAIIDSGIDPNHETLDVTDGEAFVDCEGDCDEDWDDDSDHGTHCAGTADALDNDIGVVGVNTEVDLYAVKVLDGDGSGTFSDVAAGIEWTADQGIDVGSLSLGGGDSETVRDSCEYAYSEGTLLVSSAGNDGPRPDSVTYPAAYEECIAVSATDENDDIARFSSRGEEVELAAPGVDVLSTVPDDDYDSWDGTSMACPHVAGAGAQLMANGRSNEEARDRLNETAEDIGLDDTEQGNGLVDVAEALGIEEDEENEAFFEVEITDTNSPVEEGETLEVDADIENTGDEEDTQTIELVIDNDVGTVDDEDVTLDAGDETSVTLEWETEDGDAGDYEATVSSDDDSDTDSVTVEDDEEPDGELTINTFDVQNRSNPQWTRAQVTWEVSSGDDDGELETVTSELHNGETFDEEEEDVSGFEADGEHDLRTDADNLDEHDAEVTLTVEAENDTISETKPLED